MGVVDGSGLGRATILHSTKHPSETATSAEELGEEILSGHSAAGTGSTFQTGLTKLIIDRALL